jgi:hypothetical protein
MVQNISGQLPIDPKLVNKNTTSPHEENKVKESPRQQSNMQSTVDTVTLQQNRETSITYSSSLSPEDMADRGYELLRKMVTTLLQEQGVDFEIATGTSTINLQEITQEEAQQLIAEDGYFGVEQTSTRIVDFAIALAGGDVSRLDAIKEGVEKGFNEALQAFGGSLPDISYKTLDAVMEKLDVWATEAKNRENI